MARSPGRPADAGPARPLGAERLRHLPISLALGLFVGDLATLALRGDLTLARAAASGLVSVVAYVAARWFLTRRLR